MSWQRDALVTIEKLKTRLRQVEYQQRRADRDRRDRLPLSRRRDRSGVVLAAARARASTR